MFVFDVVKGNIMKDKLGLMALVFCSIIMINACKSPEDRAQEENAMRDSAASSQTENGAVPEDAMTVTAPAQTMQVKTDTGANANTTAKKGIKGKASVLMTGIDNSKDKMEMDKNGVYARAEVMPSFPGGENALGKYVEDNLQYPQQALDNNTEGRVLLQFDVDEKGKIYNPMVISEKIGDGLEEEAVKVVKAMPQWNPGQIKGKNVKAKFTLPISYKIY